MAEVIREHNFLLILLFTLFGLMLYSYLQPGIHEAKECFLNESQCAGLEAQFIHDTKIVEINDDGFTVDQLGYIVHARGENKGLLVGDGIQFRGVWLADGTVEVSDWHISRQRNWRIYLSLAAWLFMGIVLHKTFRFDLRSMTIYSRRKDA